MDKEWREAWALLEVKCEEMERWEDEVQVVVVSVVLQMGQ